MDTQKHDTTLDYKKVMENYLDSADWRVKESSTVTYSIGGLILSNSGAVTANYWLNEIYDKEIADAHKNADIHLHDLSMYAPYCAGWNLKQLIKEGLGGVEGRITSTPARHLSTLCNQMVNFLGILQNEWAGAQAFSSFDTYLAPFVKVDNLSYKQVKQCIQSFVYGVNTPSRWGCLSLRAEVLSVDGFKKYNELKEGDLIYTWKDGELQLNPVRKVIRKPFKGKLHSYKTKNYNQIVTPNHRMLVRKHNSDETMIKRSEEIFDVKTPFALPVAFKGSAIKNDELNEDLITLAAMVYTDGSFLLEDGKVKRVTIYKSPNRFGNDELKSVAEALGLEYTVGQYDGEFGKVNQYKFYGDSARFIGELCGQKERIADKFLTMSRDQAELFLNVWASFDGDEEKQKCQYDNDTIRDQLQQIAILAGKCSYLVERKLPSGKTTKYVKIRKVDSIYPTERAEVEYDGDVWCPNVENGTAVFRENGIVFISGQTQAPFTNITLDWTVPEDLTNEKAIVGGEEMDFTYGDCQKEMDIVNKAFIEVFNEGDANGRGFQYPIPTYSITKDFDWAESENNKLLFEMAAKFGTPYFSNYINSDMKPSDIRSMCCRLRLDLHELRKKNGGYFGSGESTGSVGVVTINLPRLGYLAEDEKDFYDRLDKLMDISARSLDIKRKTITEFLNRGLYPYTKRYLGSFDNHFSTIGMVGMNEACLNAKWIREDLSHEKAHKFAEDVLNHMRDRLVKYQEQYKCLFNLEATPAESTAYRLAKHDVERYPDIITAAPKGETPYYTNSSHLPVGFTTDVFTALDLQDPLQILYTSGTVFHTYLGERLQDWKSAALLVRKIAENYKLPYFTLSPTYSICKNHGYLVGEVPACPICGEKTEVWSRITGYYRPISNWNDGKVKEFEMRKEYEPEHSGYTPHQETKEEEVEKKTSDVGLDKGIYLFGTKTCPKCKVIKGILEDKGIGYTYLDASENADLVDKLDIYQAPSMVVQDEDGLRVFEGFEKAKQALKTMI